MNSAVSDAVEKAKKQIQEAKEAGRIPQNTKEKDQSPFASDTNMLVYVTIRNGYRAGKPGRVIGCTDQELRDTLKLQANTIRWARYSMLKSGYLKYAGFTRGKIKSKVWVVDETMPVQIPQGYTAKKSIELSEVRVLSIVLIGEERFVVIEDGETVFDGHTGKLMISVVPLQGDSIGKVIHKNPDIKVILHGDVRSC
jgi:hypothetical protein